MGEITHAIMQKDRSLDVKSAERLAEGAVEALSESGNVEVRGWSIYATGSATVS